MLAIIAGTGRTLWEDLAQSSEVADVFAVNHAGLVLPRVFHLVSLHAAFIGRLAQAREALFHRQALVHAPETAPGVTNVWPESLFRWQAGSSALFAVRVALQLGYDRVVLVGVPLDDDGHFYDAPGFKTERSSFRAAWDDVALKQRVRSYSGWTREFFGAPER